MSNANANGICQYIPVGSEIIVYRNGNHEWYTTKKDIPVTTATPVTCPVREVTVLTMDYMGFGVFFLESQVVVRLTNEQEEAAKNLQLAFLQYDIPAAVSRAGRVEHPSHYLWRNGVRTSLSCWIIPHSQIPWVRMRDLTRAGCTWHVTRINVEEAPALLQRAIAALQTERAEAIRRHAENVEAAEERYRTGTASEITRANKRRNDLKRVEKALAEDLENVRNGAKALNIPFHWVEQASIRSVVRAISAGCHAHADRVGAVVDAANALGTTEGRTIAQAVTNNELPHDIATDYIEDKGGDTFSLRDVGEDDSDE